jgi:hypothetical protein
MTEEISTSRFTTEDPKTIDALEYARKHSGGGEVTQKVGYVFIDRTAEFEPNGSTALLPLHADMFGGEHHESGFDDPNLSPYTDYFEQ